MGILLLVGFLFSFLVCESLYFPYIYHADNLYLPLFARDIIHSKPLTWYLPPSSYFFPDGILVYSFSLIFPGEYVPSLYGSILFPIYLFILYSFFRKRFGRKKSNLGIQIFLLLFFMITLSLYSIDSNKQNPLGLIYTNGHHITGYIFSFYLLFRFWPKHPDPDRFTLRVWITLSLLLILLILFYSSDRLLLVFVIFPFLASTLFKNRKENRIYSILFFTLIVFTGEWIIYDQKDFFPIESSFSILQRKTEGLPPTRILFLLLNYYFDFSKLFFHRTGIFLITILFVFSLYYFRQTKRKRITSDRIFFISQTILSLLATGIIARFVYEHPYPIRYFLPMFLTFFSLCIVLYLKNLHAYSFLPLHSGISNYLLVLLLLLFSYSTFSEFGFSLREEKKILVEQLNEVAKGRTILTNYKTRNPLLFWSEGSIKSYPISQKKTPYFWITNAFFHPFWNLEIPLSEQTEEPYLEWVPNSLTKDF